MAVAEVAVIGPELQISLPPTVVPNRSAYPVAPAAVDQWKVTVGPASVVSPMGEVSAARVAAVKV